MTESKDISKHIALHSLFKSISGSFISLFVPVIIYTSSDLFNTILYLIITNLVVSLSILLFYKFIKLNALTSIIFSFVFSIPSYILLSVLELKLFIIIIIAILNGLSTAFYYSPINQIVILNKRNSNFASFQIYSTIGSILITLFNGYILNLQETFSVLLTSIISLLFFICSMVPLFVIAKHIKTKVDKSYTIKEVFKKSQKHIPFNIFFGLQDFIIYTIFPVYLYIENLTLDKVAIILAVVNLIRIFMNMLATKLYSSNKSLISVIICAIATAICLTLMPILNNAVSLYILSVISSICFPIFYVTSSKKMADDNEELRSEIMLIREFSIHGLRPIMLLPFLFIGTLSPLLYLGASFSIFIILTSLNYFKSTKEIS